MHGPYDVHPSIILHHHHHHHPSPTLLTPPTLPSAPPHLPTLHHLPYNPTLRMRGFVSLPRHPPPPISAIVTWRPLNLSRAAYSGIGKQAWTCLFLIKIIKIKRVKRKKKLVKRRYSRGLGCMFLAVGSFFFTGGGRKGREI